MATPALTHSSLDAPHGGMHFSEIYSGALPAFPPREIEQSAPQRVEGLQFSTAAALGAAKGAMVALAMEAAVVGIAVGVYEIFRHAIFLR